MTGFKARVCFLSFVFLFAGTAVNALLLQKGKLDVNQPSDKVRVVTAALPKKAPRATRRSSSEKSSQSIEDKVSAAANVGLVRAIQRELIGLNYSPGNPDGIDGIMTRAAIMAYEYDRGLAITGEPTEKLLEVMLLGGDRASTSRPGPNGVRAIQLTKVVQQALVDLKYSPGAVDGMAGNSTAKAIRAFEKAVGLKQTGRISGRLIKAIKRKSGQNFFV